VSGQEKSGERHRHENGAEDGDSHFLEGLH
jgi:hypothetical protein